MLGDSREYHQEMEFHGYPIKLEFRSANDPHVKFGLRTKGTFILDSSPGGQIAAGAILLFFGTAMLLMSFYKSYRFCVKYTFKEYFRKKRMRQYLKQ